MLLSPFIVWSTFNGIITRNGNPYHIKGINHEGFETSCRAPHFYWVTNRTYYWDLLSKNGFNSIRLPLAYDLFWQPDQIFPQQGCLAANPDLQGKSVEEVLFSYLDDAYARNFTVLLEMHTIGGIITEGPWGEYVTGNDTRDAWVALAQRFGHHPAVFGYGLKNEVHGSVTLDQFFDWAAETILAIEAAAAGKLYFLSGSQYSYKALGYDNPWGGSIADLSDDVLGSLQGPVSSNSFEDLTHPNILCQKLGSIDLLRQIVFEPHVYAASVIPGSYPSPELWEKRFGFIRSRPWHWNNTPICFTEMGGKMTDLDSQYYEAFLVWAKAKGLNTCAYWWALGVSGDTGSIVSDNDFITPLPYKIDYMQRFIPDAT